MLWQFGQWLHLFIHTSAAFVASEIEKIEQDRKNKNVS